MERANAGFLTSQNGHYVLRAQWLEKHFLDAFSISKPKFNGKRIYEGSNNVTECMTHSVTYWAQLSINKKLVQVQSYGKLLNPTLEIG
jgi:hypothetical protein